MHGYYRKDILLQIFLGDVFIDQGDNITFYKKSGKRVIESVLDNPASIGLVGSDVINEWFYDDPALSVEPIMPMNNQEGDALRFAVIRTSEQVAEDSDTYVTSYPVTARRFLGDEVTLIEAGGSIEAEVRDLGVPGFELVQSGNSVEANGLVVAVDNLAMVSLCKVQRKK